MTDDDLLSDAKDMFDLSSESEEDNRDLAREDLIFARLGEQWPEKIRDQRAREGRPTLTINRMPSFIRQVANDARMMRPQIKVSPVDSKADVETADVMSGLVRNIEQQSKADLAYDTASDFAISMGFGYFRIDVDYAFDDTFEKDIKILRIDNPFSVYGDPHDRGPDSANWNSAFLVEPLAKPLFKKKYKGAEEVDWDEGAYAKLELPWLEDEEILVAEWWVREETQKEIVLLSSGDVVEAAHVEKYANELAAQNVTVQNSRKVAGHKVKHYVLTGAEVLEKNDWPGRFIPIVPVYGEEINVDGERHLRSLIRDAKDPQRMSNYWRSASTELVALAPKAPYIGPEDAFTGQDKKKWETANTGNHAFLAFAGERAPERQAFAGIPAGALQESLNASDDMKAIMGLYDASMGARSNETSGKAIIARDRQGDVSTFHFLDNLSRAIRHGGSIVIDLIPHVYNGQRIIRTMGWDGQTSDVQLTGNPDEARPGQQEEGERDEQKKFNGIYNFTAGKYDLTVEAGPSFTTRRQEAAEQMSDLLRVFPQAAPIIGDLLVKNLDWPGADEIAERLRALVPGQNEDPRVQLLTQAIEALRGELAALKADKSIEVMNAESKAQDSESKAFDSETKRIAALGDLGEKIVNAVDPVGPYDRYQ